MASVDPTVRTKRREPIDLSGAHIPGTSLSNADLAKSNFARANLVNVNFQGSNLREADFRKANLTGANFSGADLTSADLSLAKLEGATLAGATLDEADLSHADLSEALIEGLDLSKTAGLEWSQFLEARFDETTVPPNSLKEEELLALLERFDPERPWREEYSGRMKDLLAGLSAIANSANGRILDNLLDFRIYEMKKKEEDRRRDE